MISPVRKIPLHSESSAGCIPAHWEGLPHGSCSQWERGSRERKKEGKKEWKKERKKRKKERMKKHVKRWMWGKRRMGRFHGSWWMRQRGMSRPGERGKGRSHRRQRLSQTEGRKAEVRWGLDEGPTSVYSVPVMTLSCLEMSAWPLEDLLPVERCTFPCRHRGGWPPSVNCC